MEWFRGFNGFSLAIGLISLLYQIANFRRSVHAKQSIDRDSGHETLKFLADKRVEQEISLLAASASLLACDVIAVATPRPATRPVRLYTGAVLPTLLTTARGFLALYVYQSHTNHHQLRNRYGVDWLREQAQERYRRHPNRRKEDPR